MFNTKCCELKKFDSSLKTIWFAWPKCGKRLRLVRVTFKELLVQKFGFKF